MFEKSLALCLLLSIIVVAAGQQIFQKKGEFYNAKVAIRRFEPQTPDTQINTLVGHQQLHHAIPHHHRHRVHPWRQRDRITKEEVVQNLARALLSRKMTSEEIQNEERKENQEKLKEYTMYQVRLAKKSTHPPKNYVHPRQGLPSQYTLPLGNGRVGPPQSRLPPMQPRIEQGARINGHEQKFLPRQSDQQRRPFAQVNQYSSGQRQQQQIQSIPVKTREFMKPNSFQAK